MYILVHILIHISILLFCSNKKYLCYYVAAAGDPNAWRLGRIEETDHETPV